MKNSEAYLQAAELIDSRQELYSCCAIARVVGGSAGSSNFAIVPLARTYVEDTEFSLWDADIQLYAKRAQQIRVLLLCLMAAKAESEGD